MQWCWMGSCLSGDSLSLEINFGSLFIWILEFVSAVTSLLCCNNLSKQWVVDFLVPSMLVTCPVTLGSLRLKISFTRSVLAILFCFVLDDIPTVVRECFEWVISIAVRPHSGYRIEGSTSSSMLLLCWGTFLTCSQSVLQDIITVNQSFVLDVL